MGAGGALLRTVNGGAAWTKATSPTTRDLSAIAMSGSRGIAVGNVGTVLVTADGVNWSAAGSGPPPDTVTAVIDSVSPNPAVEGRTVTFTGHGTDSLGSWNHGLRVEGGHDRPVDGRLLHQVGPVGRTSHDRVSGEVLERHVVGAGEQDGHDQRELSACRCG